MNDWIDIGVYRRPTRGEKDVDRDGVPIYLRKQRVRSGAQQFTILVSERPSRAGIDPLHEQIDRITGDNTIGIRTPSLNLRPSPAGRAPRPTPDPTERAR